MSQLFSNISFVIYVKLNVVFLENLFEFETEACIVYIFCNYKFIVEFQTWTSYTYFFW